MNKLASGLALSIAIMHLIPVTPVLSEDKEKLKDENGNVKWKAFCSLIILGEPAIGPLIQALKDEDGEIRAMAAFALGEINDSAALKPLIQILADNDVRKIAAWSIGHLKDPEAILH